MPLSDDYDWPPKDAALFIRSRDFAEFIISIVEGLKEKYPQRDFADAVASLFTWLDTKLSNDPKFLSSAKFPSLGAFRAYLRQAAWNVSRLAERQRSQHARILEFREDFEPVSTAIDAVAIAIFHECKERLSTLHRRIYELCVEDELPDGYKCDRLPFVASIIQSDHSDLTESDVRKLLEEACDALLQCVGSKKEQFGRKRGRRKN